MCMLLSFQRPPRLCWEGIPPSLTLLRSLAPERASESSAPAAGGNPRRGRSARLHRGAAE